MLFNGRVLIFTFSGTQVRIAEIERLQSLFKMSMEHAHALSNNVECVTSFPTQDRPTVSNTAPWSSWAYFRGRCALPLPSRALPELPGALSDLHSALFE